MGITIQHRGEWDVPVILCDSCGKEIVGRGNVCFAAGEQQTADLMFWHKPSDSPGCQDENDIYPLSFELDEFLDMIVNNFDQVGQGRKAND